MIRRKITLSGHYNKSQHCVNVVIDTIVEVNPTMHASPSPTLPI